MAVGPGPACPLDKRALQRTADSNYAERLGVIRKSASVPREHSFCYPIVLHAVSVFVSLKRFTIGKISLANLINRCSSLDYCVVAFDVLMPCPHVTAHSTLLRVKALRHLLMNVLQHLLFGVVNVNGS